MAGRTPQPSIDSRPSTSHSPSPARGDSVDWTRSRSRAPLLPRISERHDVEANGNAKTASRPRSALQRVVSLLQEAEKYDPRPLLPTWLARFSGYRNPSEPQLKPIWLFLWLEWLRIPLIVEATVFAAVCAFGTAVALAELTRHYTQVEDEQPTTPLVLGFMGAAMTILFAMPLTPVATPRNLVFGHLIAVISSLIFRPLSRTQPMYSGGAALAVTMAVQTLTGCIHPPGGALALLGTLTPALVDIKAEQYVALIMWAVGLMLAVALLSGNAGRRKYPAYWLFPPKPPRSHASRVDHLKKHPDGLGVALLEDALSELDREEEKMNRDAAMRDASPDATLLAHIELGKSAIHAALLHLKTGKRDESVSRGRGRGLVSVSGSAGSGSASVERGRRTEERRIELQRATSYVLSPVGSS